MGQYRMLDLIFLILSNYVAVVIRTNQITEYLYFCDM